MLLLYSQNKDVDTDTDDEGTDTDGESFVTAKTSLPLDASIVEGRKIFTKLENNPEFMNKLAVKLGLSPALKFYDVYSLVESELLGDIPRPVYALLFIIPLTSAWETIRLAKDTAREPYEKCGADEPIIWFKQIISGACGAVGLLHCLLNGPAQEYILPDTTLSQLYEKSIPLNPGARAELLYNNEALEEAHQSCAELGDTKPPPLGKDNLGLHFVAFVKGDDGWLWELDGNRVGPVRRGPLEEDEDLLSEHILKRCIGGLVEMDGAQSVSLPIHSLDRGRSLRDEGVPRRGIWDPTYRHPSWSPPPPDHGGKLPVE
ncbi:14c0071e-ab85-484f-827a-7d7e717d65aa [Sclerotinia trifoliorum]|uniref:Ubiquitin carboxyl-terminal hydrolase n=1 Tax=Sclerotinia trifoliorum TaxID=28548 RepID=A0A8H2VXD6_9HELO|nr:14c0071e-ab85-484f-827a-7d7e717d65aa [Sclerotinia trifoliorum]